MRHDFDVIIVGAGPAGATLADELVRKGVSVALLEKESLPRYKCCAGGLSLRAARLIHQDISTTIEKEITGATFTFAGKKPYCQYDTGVIGYTIMRDKFDYALTKHAEKDGVIVLQEHEVRRINMNDKMIQVFTTMGDFQSKIIVGSDGTLGTVARYLHLKRNFSYIVAVESEITVTEKARQKWNSHITIDLGQISGYAWVFPKSDHLSIGIGSHRSKEVDMKRYYREFLNSLHLGTHNITQWHGSLIPISKGKVSAVRGRALLLGDAAGLADPLTGEGIYNAILSAHIAAPVIVKSLHDGSGDLMDYQVALEKEIFSELKIAKLMSNIFLRFPSVVFETLKRDDRIWKTCYALMRGDINYRGIQNGLKTLGGIYHFLTGK